MLNGQKIYSPTHGVYDQLNRPLRDLRISLTDRCNFRCKYCMPREIFGPDFAFMPQEQLLSFTEIVRLAKIFASCGVQKIRLTGGEPLLRHGIEALIESLSHVPGIEDIALTTNGSLLTPQKARALKSAGLKRITISLDSLQDDIFTSMNDVHFPVAKVLQAIQAASDAGLAPVKINMVVQRGMNDDSILEMAEYCRRTGCILRFIEFMDVGNSNGWRLEQVVPAKEILRILNGKWPVDPISPNYRGEVAERYRYQDGQGEIGIVASVTHAFCSDCTRARISAEGRLYTCLFASTGYDLRTLLRSGKSDEEVLEAVQGVWRNRSDRYSELRSKAIHLEPKVEMSHIGG